MAPADKPDQLQELLAAAVEAFNASVDPVERVELIAEIRSLRARISAGSGERSTWKNVPRSCAA